MATKTKSVTKAYALKNFKTGDRFKGKINKVDCTGIIHNTGVKVYYCTDRKSLDGERSSVKHGKRYSWLHDDAVTSIIITKKAKIVTKKTGSIIKPKLIRKGDLVYITNVERYSPYIEKFLHANKVPVIISRTTQDYLYYSISTSGGEIELGVYKNDVTKGSVNPDIPAEPMTDRFPYWQDRDTVRIGCNRLTADDLIGFQKIMYTILIRSVEDLSPKVNKSLAIVSTLLATRPKV